MFWQSSRAWHSACLVLIVSATYRNPFLRLSLSLSENQLCTTPSMQSSSCCPSYHLPAPPPVSPALHQARHAAGNAGTLPRAGLGLGGNSGKSNISAHSSLAKNTGSRAILRDDGMGKLCLESWVSLSRQGCQADVGRGAQSSPGAEGTALGRLGTALPGAGVLGRLLCCLQSLMGVHRGRTHLLQGPGLLWDGEHTWH